VLYIVTNADGATNQKLVRTPSAKPSRSHWTPVFAYDSAVNLGTVLYCTVLLYYTTRLYLPYLYSYCTHHTVLTILHSPYCTVLTILHSPYCTHHTVLTILHSPLTIRIISLYASSHYRMRGVLRAFRGRLRQGGRHECSVGGASSG
jgi:hypothetical protein